MSGEARFGLFVMILVTCPFLAIGFAYRACTYAFEIGMEWFDLMVEKS